MERNIQMSPCTFCTRVENPLLCENKNCGTWRQWYICRWDSMRQAVRESREMRPQYQGIVLGGRRYAAPDQVRQYLETDPCGSCEIPRNLCQETCRVRQDWEKKRKEILG